MPKVILKTAATATLISATKMPHNPNAMAAGNALGIKLIKAYFVDLYAIKIVNVTPISAINAPMIIERMFFSPIIANIISMLAP